jgi:hypothetical protein
MRKAHFTAEQMVAIIREADREPVSVGGQAARDQRADDLHMAQAFRWPSGELGQAPEATRGRECAAEEAGCRA